MAGIELVRRVRTRDVEIWEIREAAYLLCKLLLLDLRRPSTLQDYPYLIEMDDADSFAGRENFIKAIAVAQGELANEQKAEVAAAVENLLQHVAQSLCDWNVSFAVAQSIDAYVEQVLEENGIVRNKHDLSKMKHLSND